MANSLKASALGLQIINQARRKKGWNKTAPAWCSIAFTSKATLNRFWARQAIRSETFIAICQAVEVDWEKIVEQEEFELDILLTGQTFGAEGYQDWGDAPDPDIFYGRLDELDTLKQWIVTEQSRLITVLGMGGIGKTTFVAKIAQDLESDFELLIWRSLRNAPSANQIVTDLIQFLSKQQEADLPDDLDGKMLRLLHYLRNFRCLLVLDNVESILQSGDRVGEYRPGYEEFGQLFKMIGETSHQSCLLLTSRELPKEVNILAGETSPVRCFRLHGLSTTEGQEIFREKGNFVGSQSQWQTAIASYGGNPLALKIVASAVQDLFDGDIGYFLDFIDREGSFGSFIFEDIGNLLQQQWERLTSKEKKIMYWLAINREPVSVVALEEDCMGSLFSKELLQGLTALQKRSLIEKTSPGFTQQPVVMEYVVGQLIDEICTEIFSQNLFLFRSHALVKAQDPEYVRDTQISLILQPIIERLLDCFSSSQAIADHFRHIVHELKSTPSLERSNQATGYICGNIINILRQLQIDLSGYDFSYLNVWQANLQGCRLHRVDFTGCDLRNSVFTETLGNILSAAFSPDGKLMATCDTDCQIRLWQVKTGKLLCIFEGHDNWVRSIAFSNNGQILASGSADCTVKIWDIQHNSCLQTLRGHDNEVFSVAFSPNSPILASSSGDHTVKIWDIQNGQCVHTLNEHKEWIRSVAFSPNGQILASGSDDRTVKIWHIQNGKCLKTYRGHQNWVRSVAFNDDGQILASGSSDRTVKIWHIQNDKCIETYRGHRDGIYALTFSPDGQILASGSGDCTVRLWDIHNHQCVKTLQGHQNQIFSVAFNADNQTLICASLDKTVRHWDIHEGKCLKTWLGHTDWSLPVTFSHDDKTIVSGSNDKSVRLWDIKTSKCLRSFSGHRDRILTVAFASFLPTLVNDGLIASGSIDNTIKIWKNNSCGCLRTLSGHSDWVRSLAFGYQRAILASASADRTIKLWDINNGNCLKTLIGHSEQVYSVAFSPDDRTLISGSTDQTVRLWDVNNGNCLKTFSGHTNRVFSVAFSPQANMIASGSIDRTVKLWNVSNGNCLKTLKGHTNWVFSVAFSPDGKILASGSHDRTVRLWDVNTGRYLKSLRGHQRLVSSIAFSPDGQTLASGSQDQTIRLWNILTGDCLKIFRAERIYEGMNITGAKGLTNAQKVTLKALGAV